MGVPLQGSPAVGGGGNPLVGYRDILDAKRSAAAPQMPNATYPDGYLGNVGSRREDRLLQAVQSRLTQRNYQRGVHKGDKIDNQDYIWPTEFSPDRGLRRQATAIPSPVGDVLYAPKQALAGLPVEQINHMGKNHMLAPQQLEKTAKTYGVDPAKTGPPVLADPNRRATMSRLLPNWK